MKHSTALLWAFIVTTTNLFGQVPSGGGLVLNEINQGSAGTKEFMEFLVIGDPDNPCDPVDLSNWVIDDNNGSFESCGSGVGIATGHYRLSAGCFSAVPPGAILLIYNAADPYTGLPADDPDDADGDLVYIIPSNSTCLEANYVVPTATGPDCSYAGPYSAPTLTWAAGMSNSGDAAQVRQPDYTFFHGYSYGDVSGTFPAWPSGAPAGTSANLGGGGNWALNCGNFYLTANYSSTSAGSGTPGLPNNADNENLVSLIQSCSFDYNTFFCCVPDSTILPAAVCEGEVFILPDGTSVTIDAPGLYTVSLTGASGCDSVVGFDVTLLPIVAATIDTGFCEGEIFILPDGTSVTVDAPASYDFTLPGLIGCDTLLTINVDVLPALTSTIDTGFCEGEIFILPDGTSVTVDAPASYEVTLPGLSGCDTLLTINVDVLPALTSTIDTGFCEGEIFMLPDGTSVTVDAPASYDFTLPGSSGCDTLLTINVDVLPALTSTIDTGFCAGETFILPDGTLVTVDFPFSLDITLPGSGGCDTILTLNVDVLPNITTAIADDICPGEILILADGTEVTTPGTYEVTISAPGACDSIFIYTIATGEAFSVAVSESICSGDTYVLPDGTIVSDAGVYNTVLTAASGCDSIITTTLTLTPLPDATILLDTNAYCISAGLIDLVAATPGGTWSGTGVVGTQFNPAVAGIGGPYTITYALGGPCPAEASFNISVYAEPVLSLDIPLVICIENGPINLLPSPSGGILTGPGISGYQFDPATTGAGGPFNITYTYTDAGGCTATLDASLFVYDYSIDAGPDTTILLGTSYSINLTEPGATYTWTPAGSVSCSDCANPVFTPTVTTTYSVTSTDVYGCTATDELTIYVDTDIDYNIYVPNAFSPNGDGINDVFNILGNGIARVRILSIYDRWGNIIFRSEPAVAGANGWDGTYNGRELNIGVYVWVAEVELLDGNVVLRSGNVTLVK